jgi:hypothetical protein
MIAAETAVCAAYCPSSTAIGGNSANVPEENAKKVPLKEFKGALNTFG